MKAEPRLIDRLTHMLEAASRISSYVEGMDKASFLTDERTQQAIVLNLLIIGEAATKLLSTETEFLDRHPEVEWKNMKGMRNRIAHAYYEISINTVWETVDKSVADLVSRLPAIIECAQARQHQC